MTNWIQDAGHGGSDPGACAKGNVEKEYTLEAALYVDKRLGEHGIGSHCTRSKDVSLSESSRVSKASKYKYCISHHYNAGGGLGAEAIHSIHANGQFEHKIIEEFKAAGYPVRPKSVYFRKGSNGDYYYMHRRTGNCRTTIIEYDFVDGPQAEKIKSKAYREGMYECVVRAICREEGVKYKPVKSAAPKKDPKGKSESVKIQTGGLNPDTIKEVSEFFIKNKWYAEITFNFKEGNPTATTGGLSETTRERFESWLNERGWWYKVIK